MRVRIGITGWWHSPCRWAPSGEGANAATDDLQSVEEAVCKNLPASAGRVSKDKPEVKLISNLTCKPMNSFMDK